MKKIRSRRLTKKGRSLKNRYFTIFTKLFAIALLLFFTGSLFISPTTAYFDDTTKITGSVTAANHFPGKNNGKQKIKRVAERWDCNEIYGTFKNSGKGNATNLPYEVLWRKGSSTTVVHKGTVSILAGKSKTLHYDPIHSDPKQYGGKYRFVVHKEPGNNGNGIVQSQWINVTECKTTSVSKPTKVGQDSVKTDDSKKNIKTNNSLLNNKQTGQPNKDQQDGQSNNTNGTKNDSDSSKKQTNDTQTDSTQANDKQKSGTQTSNTQKNGTQTNDTQTNESSGDQHSNSDQTGVGEGSTTTDTPPVKGSNSTSSKTGGDSSTTRSGTSTKKKTVNKETGNSSTTDQKDETKGTKGTTGSEK